ncbi:hypothetical protein PAEPH01_1669 [Pancytospora epiphaga]|nr:hypothetical protein PAEPH01_1669 [Pancytospora epiphaga]
MSSTGQGNNLNKLPVGHDMAMTTNNRMTRMVQVFSGIPEEDVSKWVANAKFMLTLFFFDDTEAKRLICLDLAGDTFDWVRQVVQREPGITGSALLWQLES